ncbi:hypothetical protein QBC43DRAFT_80083 [Cladorrhinum sp. PSN259]|nr:hypothetical protein QBC43DRAFT_80083 [Cladorrhinum sp. PSN259]
MVIQQPETSSEAQAGDIHSLPVYLIEWRHDAEKDIYTRRHPVVGLKTPHALGAALRKSEQGGGKRLFVFHGMPPDFLSTLLESETHTMDDDFSEACAERKRYNPTVINPSKSYRGGIIWEYPELIHGDDIPPPATPPRESDLMKKPPIKSMTTSGGKVSAIFSRACLWETGTADNILFLDKPLWNKSATVKWESTFEGRFLSSSERLSSSSSSSNGLRTTMSSLIHKKWLSLLDALEAPPPLPPRLPSPPNLDDTINLYWQLLSSLESNQSITDWTSPLLSSVERRISLLSLSAQSRGPRRRFLPIDSPSSSSFPPLALQNPRNSFPTTAGLPLRRRRKPRLNTGEEEKEKDENQRSLDRISYLGGILLPIPIVSGILSMGDTFGPTAPKFYLFWAIALPLSLLGVLIIYADTVRKMEVWVEVTAGSIADGGGASGGGGQGHHHHLHHLSLVGDCGRVPSVDWDEEKGYRVNDGSSSGGGGGGHDHGRRDHDVEERIVGGLPESIIVERLPDGDDGEAGRMRAWKKEELGWWGAVRGVFWMEGRGIGAKKVRRDVPEGVLIHGYERRTRTI